MKKNIWTVCILCLVGLFIISCATKDKASELDGISLPLNVNKSIKIWPVDNISVYSYGDLISFFIENASDSTVIAPGDFNMQLFVFNEEENEWVEVPDLIEHDMDEIIMNDSLKMMFMGVKPDIRKSTRLQRLLIVVFGRIKLDNEDGEVVGAYFETKFK